VRQSRYIRDDRFPKAIANSTVNMSLKCFALFICIKKITFKLFKKSINISHDKK